MRMIDEGEHENEHENTAQHSTAQYRSTRRMNNEWMNTHDGEDENDEDDDEDEDDKEADRHEQPNTQTHKTGLGYPLFLSFLSLLEAVAREVAGEAVTMSPLEAVAREVAGEARRRRIRPSASCNGCPRLHSLTTRLRALGLLLCVQRPV